MRLIDADALKKDWSMGNRCEDCPRDARNCQYDMVLTRMDVCEMLDDAPTVGGWISVQDRLPEHVDRVPVLYRFTDSELQDGKLHTAMFWYVREPFCGDEPPHWERVGRYEYEVLYWFELPGAPEEVQG